MIYPWLRTRSRYLTNNCWHQHKNCWRQHKWKCIHCKKRPSQESKMFMDVMPQYYSQHFWHKGVVRSAVSKWTVVAAVQQQFQWWQPTIANVRYCHVMYKLLYSSIRVRTAPPVSVRVRVRVSVSFSLCILFCMCGSLR